MDHDERVAERRDGAGRESPGEGGHETPGEGGHETPGEGGHEAPGEGRREVAAGHEADRAPEAGAGPEADRAPEAGAGPEGSGGNRERRPAPFPGTDTPPAAELYRSLADLAYTMAGPRAHTRLRTEAEVPVDRASLALLRTLASASAPMRMGELAAALMVRASHVSREVRRLRQQGLVTFLTDARDHRVRQITVTGEGRDLVERAQATGRRWLTEALHSFSPEELDTTARVIRRVNEAYRSE